jgi:hypothetical protein
MTGCVEQMASAAKMSGGSGGLDLDSLSNEQSSIKATLGKIAKHLANAQSSLAQALKLRDEASMVDSKVAALTSGNTDAALDVLKTVQGQGDIVSRALAENKTLDAAQKAKVSESLLEYAKGAAGVLVLGKAAALQAKKITEHIASNPMQAVSLKEQFGDLITLGTELPKIGAALVKQGFSYLELAKASGIETKNIAEALKSDVGFEG